METNKKANGYAKKLIELVAKKSELDISKYDMDELAKGMVSELEHGSAHEETNITNDDATETLKIVLAHMNEIPDYYTRLEKMENEAGSIKTETPDEEGEEEADEDKKEQEEKKVTMESVAKRYIELCGIMENEEKKQLKNPLYQESKKKTLLTEEIDPTKFDVVKFRNDGLGKKNSAEEIDLYEMQKKEKEN